MFKEFCVAFADIFITYEAIYVGFFQRQDVLTICVGEPCRQPVISVLRADIFKRELDKASGTWNQLENDFVRSRRQRQINIER